MPVTNDLLGSEKTVRCKDCFIWHPSTQCEVSHFNLQRNNTTLTICEVFRNKSGNEVRLKYAQ